jgi:hypothetical protein
MRDKQGKKRKKKKLDQSYIILNTNESMGLIMSIEFEHLIPTTS